jgi:carbamoyl-phosphate synthase large subunit
MKSKNINVLIMSCHWRNIFVRLFKEALTKDERISGKVVCIDMNPLSSALYEGDYYEIVPPMDDPDFFPCLKEIFRKYDIGVVIPSTDNDLQYLSKNKKAIEDENVKAIVSDEEIIRITSDKYETYKFFIKNEIETPRSWLPEEFKAIHKYEFPLIIKPRFGIGSKGVFKVENQEELDFYISRVDRPIIQKFISGKEFSFDTFSSFEGIPIEIVPRERISTRSGEIFRGRTVNNGDLIAQVISLLSKINLTGPGVAQGFANENNFMTFTEINPRFGSGLPLSVKAGADLPLYLLLLVAGFFPECRLGRFKDNFIMLRYDDAIFIDSSDIPDSFKK